MHEGEHGGGWRGGGRGAGGQFGGGGSGACCKGSHDDELMRSQPVKGRNRSTVLKMPSKVQGVFIQFLFGPPHRAKIEN